MRNQSMGSDVRWKTIMVESVAVIASILLAFGIDASWELRQERLAEREVMDALYIEMRSNRDTLVETIQRNDRAAELFIGFLALTPDELVEKQPDRLLVPAIWAPYTYDPEVGMLTLFLGSGTTVNETAREIRRSAVNWQTLLADADEEVTVMWETSREVLGYMTEHLSGILPAEGSKLFVLNIVSEDYGPRMALIRADEKLLAAAKAKFALQTIYNNELENLLVQTDLLLALLDPKAN